MSKNIKGYEVFKIKENLYSTDTKVNPAKLLGTLLEAEGLCPKFGRPPIREELTRTLVLQAETPGEVVKLAHQTELGLRQGLNQVAKELARCAECKLFDKCWKLYIAMLIRQMIQGNE